MSYLRLPHKLGALLAVLALGIPASSAIAAPYEQINRANGAFGGSPIFGIDSKATAIGDVGRYAGWEEVKKETERGLYDTNGFVRDIQTNTTITYGGGVHRVYAIDRAEHRALILRTRAGQQQVVAVPVAGGAPIIVAQFPDTVTMPEAVLSGDGRKVVVSQQDSPTKIYDLTGGIVRVVRTLPSLAVGGAARSINDDASVFAVYDPLVGPSLWVRGKVIATDAMSPVIVDSRGTVAAWVSGSGRGVVLRNLATGTERTWPIPVADPLNFGVALWVSDGGDRIVVGGGGVSAEWPGARVLSTDTGTWAAFGDRFTSAIGGGTMSQSLVSANARFATTAGGVIILVNTSGQHIVGANEGLAAGAYLYAGSQVSQCNEQAAFNVYLFQPAPFVPAPVKAVITAKVGGTVFASGTITHPMLYPVTALPDGSIPGWKVTGDYDPTGPDVTLTATVTDGSGRVLTETWTEPDPYCGG